MREKHGVRKNTRRNYHVDHNWQPTCNSSHAQLKKPDKFGSIETRIQQPFHKAYCVQLTCQATQQQQQTWHEVRKQINIGKFKNTSIQQNIIPETHSPHPSIICKTNLINIE